MLYLDRRRRECMGCCSTSPHSILKYRRESCRAYHEALAGSPGIALPPVAESVPLYYFPVLVENKEALLEKARRARIELAAWPIRAPLYPVERENDLPKYGYEPGSCPVAEDVARRLVGLPTDLKTRERQREGVISLLREHGLERDV